MGPPPCESTARRAPNIGSRAQDRTDHVTALNGGPLSNETDNWMTGINRNIKGTEQIMERHSGERAGVSGAVQCSSKARVLEAEAFLREPKEPSP